MKPAHVWLLNLDGDDELARPDVPRDVFAALERRPALRESLAGLVHPGVVIGRGERAPSGAIGHAFQPTARACEALRRAGSIPVDSPPLATLRRVADRRFALGLGPGHAPGARIVDDVEALEAYTVRTRGPRVLKRLFGYAGRGRLLSPGGPVSGPERAFAEKAVATDGAFVLEPWLDRVADLAIHGFVDREGATTLGAPTLQVTTPAGAWRSSKRASDADLAEGEARSLRAEAARAAAALHAAGYWGPFGVDAFRWRKPEGEEALVPRCEVNARYTMGWAIGMGDRRPDLQV